MNKKWLRFLYAWMRYCSKKKAGREKNIEIFYRRNDTSWPDRKLLRPTQRIVIQGIPWRAVFFSLSFAVFCLHFPKKIVDRDSLEMDPLHRVHTSGEIAVWIVRAFDFALQRTKCYCVAEKSSLLCKISSFMNWLNA